MSYELDFWRQDEDATADPSTVYEQLLEGNSVPGILVLPTDSMRERVRQEFADWLQLDADTWAKDERETAPGFQLFTTPYLFRVDCYGLAGADMNRFIDVALEFECPLFDPQTRERFS